MTGSPETGIFSLGCCRFQGPSIVVEVETGAGPVDGAANRLDKKEIPL